MSDNSTAYLLSQPQADDMGPSISMAIEAENDDHFEKSTFDLKRTRTLGLLDEYIDPTKKLLGKYKDIDTDDTTAYKIKNEKENKKENLKEDLSLPAPDTDTFLIHHDDNDLVYEPNRHVDYLSHKWDESEISQSWKYIILKKKKRDQDLIDAARLENASWRTWAKARNNLKTVRPEVVNWSKDSDVTWLYGPIVRNTLTDETGLSNSNDTYHEEIGYGSDDETSKRVTKKICGPKPILKKRTVSEIIEENSLWRLNVARQHRKQLANIDASLYPFDTIYLHDNYDALAAKVNMQYYSNNFSVLNERSPTPISVNNDNINSTDDNTSDPIENFLSTDTVLDNLRAKPSSILTSFNKKEKLKDRHIHFNNRVEQSIGVVYTDTEYESNESSTEWNNFYNKPDDCGKVSKQLYDNNKIPNMCSTRINNLNSSEGLQSYDSLGMDVKDSDYDSDDSSNLEAGLFINATSRKNDGIHTPTDMSSIGSKLIPGVSLRPNIKLLPATTLNYGSDDECYDNRDGQCYTSNAISHNVNTLRGYDYMYDYNSVYTADTSIFLNVNNCDILDVPENIALQTSLDETENLNYSIDSDLQYQDQITLRTKSQSRHPQHNMIFSFNDNDSEDSDSQQFIEDSKYCDLDDESDIDDTLVLKRTCSVGNHGLGSFQNLQFQSDISTLPANTHNFINGLPINQLPDNHIPRATKISDRSLGENFTLDNNFDSQENLHDNFTQKNLISPSPIILSKNFRTGKSNSSFTNLSASKIILNNSQTSLNDDIVPGYISPRNDSIHSMIVKEKIVENQKASSVEQISREIEDYNLGSVLQYQNKDSNESLQKMMSSAKELANKYLQSWTK